MATFRPGRSHPRWTAPRSGPGSYRDRCLDGWMVLVADDLDVLIPVIEDRVARRQAQHGERVWLAAELLGDLLNVIVVDVAVATGPDELARPVSGLRRHHVGQQGIAGEVERHAEEKVGAALVELAAQGAVGDVELEERMTRRQCHPVKLGDIPRRDDQPPGVWCGSDGVDHLRNLIDVLAGWR